jgi:FMN-dependent NADH-azoreductase
MTHTILHIDSSPMGDRSISRKLTGKVLAELQARFPGSKVTTHDFAATPLPHVNGPMLGAFFTPPDQRSAEQVQLATQSDELITELFAADVIVIGVPMWNFGIPSSLKAWIDHVIRAGKTFAYGANGPEGLIPAGKKVIIVSSRGAVYTEGPYQSLDFQEEYLRSVFAFVGLKDVSFVRAEGVAMGEDAVKAAMATADAHLAKALEAIA